MIDNGEARPKGKLEIKIGNMSFSAEGDQEWLDQQVTKLLKAAEEHGTMNAPSGAGSAEGSGPKSGQHGSAHTQSLASYLKAKGADAKQVQRFLATAAWLFRRGNENLNTGAISKALTEHHQKRLANPADCLNKNVGKGYCEKTKDGFFITPEGWQSLGEEQ